MEERALPNGFGRLMVGLGFALRGYPPSRIAPAFMATGAETREVALAVRIADNPEYGRSVFFTGCLGLLYDAYWREPEAVP